MKKTRLLIVATTLGFASIVLSTQAQIGGINSASSTATIKFDDQNSFFGASNGGLYQQNSPAWSGASLTLSQTDATTGDAANGDLSASGGGATYNILLNNVSMGQPVGNTGYADLTFLFSVQYQLTSAWNTAPTFFPNFLVSGTVQSTAGSYAMVRGQIDYWVFTSAGTYGQVDQVNYNWIYNTPGAFINQTVSGSAMNGNLGNLVSGTTITMNGSLT